MPLAIFLLNKTTKAISQVSLPWFSEFLSFTALADTREINFGDYRLLLVQEEDSPTDSATFLLTHQEVHSLAETLAVVEQHAGVTRNLADQFARLSLPAGWAPLPDVLNALADETLGEDPEVDNPVMRALNRANPPTS